VKPSAVALNQKLKKTLVGRLWAKRPGVANAFKAGIDPTSAFLSPTALGYRERMIALIKIDHGIRPVEKQRVVRYVLYTNPAAIR
jgi:hypothetical protein